MAILIVFIIFLIYGVLSKGKDSYSEEDIFVESSSNVTNTENKQAESVQNKIIKVQIKGEVKEPGVYSLNNGERVEDLIKLAGGFTIEADIDRVVSQAKKLRDEECIVVPKKGEISNVSPKVTSSLNDSNISDDISEKVNINTATKEELMKVPGIGEVIADNIIKYREDKGDFSSIEDLKNVDRIGDKTLEKMKEKLEVN